MTTLLLRPLSRTRLTRALGLGVRLNSTASAPLQPGTTRDPSHPHLYFHAFPAPPATPKSLVMTFTPSRPTEYFSFLPLGSVPPLDPVDAADGDGGEGAEGGPKPNMAEFREHPYFRSVLNAAIRDGLGMGVDKGLEYEAKRRPSDGYITIMDERSVPDHDRTGATEDLIGSVFVQDGKIVPGTYEPMATYRLVTPAGVMRLPEGLDRHLMSVLEGMVEQEAENARLDAEEIAGIR